MIIFACPSLRAIRHGSRAGPDRPTGVSVPRGRGLKAQSLPCHPGQFLASPRFGLPPSRPRKDGRQKTPATGRNRPQAEAQARHCSALAKGVNVRLPAMRQNSRDRAVRKDGRDASRISKVLRADGHRSNPDFGLRRRVGSEPAANRLDHLGNELIDLLRGAAHELPRIDDGR